MPLDEAARPLPDRRVGIQVGEEVVTEHTVCWQGGCFFADACVDCVVQRHELADDQLRFVEAGILRLGLAEYDRHPFGRRDQLGRARDSKEKALKFVIAESIGGPHRIGEKRLQQGALHS